MTWYDIYDIWYDICYIILQRTYIIWQRTLIIYYFITQDSCTYISCHLYIRTFFWRFDPMTDHSLPLRGYTITLIGHTTVGRTPLGDWSAQSTDLYLPTHSIHNRQTSIAQTSTCQHTTFTTNIHSTDLYLWTHNTQNRQTSIAQTSTCEHTTLKTDRHP